MKRIIVIATLVLIGLIAAGGGAFWYLMQQPLYTPGMVRAAANLRAPLTPPLQVQGPESKRWWTVEPDIQLHHFAAGTGTNVLVVHGGPGEPFAAPIAALAPLTDRYAFHYYDQRGCGESTRPIDKFTSSNYHENMQTADKTLGLGAQIADIERARRILGDDRLILIGHSFGGFLAALYAAEFPEHVRALILVAPAEMLVMPPASGGLFEQVKPLLPDEMKPEYDAYLKRYLDFGSIFAKSDADLVALNNEFARYYTIAAHRKGFDVPADSASEAAAGGWMVQAMYLSMGMQHDYRSALKGVTAPVLVLHGENDLQLESASRMYAEAFPNAEFQTIKNAGHFGFADRPAEFAGAVGRFLDKVP
jgi:proline iminopeptidase